MGQKRNRLAQVAPEAALLLGAGRAILLQLADPQVGRAIAEHSDFAANPLSRLIHTLGYIYALSNGSDEQQRAIIEHVNRAHAPVHGTRNKTSNEPAYSAFDPNLQLWVAATLFDSARALGAQVLPWWQEVAGDQLYREYARLGDALQMPTEYWPEHEKAFNSYFAQRLTTLNVNESVKSQATELFRGQHAPWWIRLPLPLMRDVTIAQLPPRVRELFGYEITASVRRRNAAVIFSARAATRILPRFIRHAPARMILKYVQKMSADSADS
ncbi:oxygenase MpaB family protein [Glutamicibacter sp.]|uniref:oxygenase MpaB family protein n=1 Tax=Glutamicibacter sp. TaxID=1931995 RepID=UPI0028BF2472|nr:oxygenase MpaB family protein [Glutamicibacter sp.]